MQKNTAGKWVVFAFDRTTNIPKTGDAANITANLRIDGAAANAVDDTNPAELEDGYYVFDITADEANGNNIVISPESTTANIQVIGVPGAVWTTPPAFNTIAIASAKVDTQVKGWDDINLTAKMKADVNAEADTALTDYDPPTRTEATADKAAIIVYVDKIDDATDGLTAIKAEVEGLAGAAMRGTDGANTVVPDAAGTAAGLHATTDGKIDTLLTRISASVATALTKIADVAIAGTETAGSLLKLFYDRVTGAVALEANVESHVVDAINSIASTFTRTDDSLLADGTEQTLYINDAPVDNWIPDSININLSVMGASDVITLKLYIRQISAGSYLLYDTQQYSGVQTVTGVSIRGIPNRYGFKITLQQTAGTYRTFASEVMVIA